MTECSTRRREILDAAAELFARKGVAATTIREIADRVGVVSGALYHHFPSKLAIVDELVIDYLEELQRRYRAIDSRDLDPRSRLQAIVDTSLAVAHERPHATAVYQDELPHLRKRSPGTRASELADEVQQAWIDTIEDGKRRGAFRNDLPADVFHRFIRDCVWLSTRWHTADDAYTTHRLAADCVTIFLDGFAVDTHCSHPDSQHDAPAPAAA
ncbi:TetR family transcriptional regulator [Rhodococcus sp. OK519]|uniref:TetR/AcrR family transcriptional regulator n=1 Tax=Rhodococcus sp. OK519 TaxID=2135729 RepID=UPI000D3C0F22|nr:TetR family transcriptional regulator [Rhodococcus sp. OK519]